MRICCRVLGYLLIRTSTITHCGLLLLISTQPPWRRAIRSTIESHIPILSISSLVRHLSTR